MCVCVCVCVYVRACVSVCVCVGGGGGGGVHMQHNVCTYVCIVIHTLVNLLQGHPSRQRKVVSQTGWSLTRGNFMTSKTSLTKGMAFHKGGLLKEVSLCTYVTYIRTYSRVHVCMCVHMYIFMCMHV